MDNTKSEKILFSCRICLYYMDSVPEKWIG